MTFVTSQAAAVTQQGSGGGAADGATKAGSELSVRGLTKHYGSFTAVDGIDLDVPEGSFFALLGPSGCGKTTTLRMVAGLDEPSAGAIYLGGEDISRKRAFQRPVNTVFQNYALFPHLTIFENVAFGLRRRGESNIEPRVLEMLEMVELAHLAKRKPTQLSGGQQQRIAVVRALVNRPQVLLLDEPLGALDLKLRRQLQLELKRIQTEVGITFVHVTHDQEEAMTMADTIAVMNLGKVEQLGSAIDLYENPVSVFVANFLGQSNFIRGTATGTDGQWQVVETDIGTFRVPTARNSAPDADVLVGVRPEKLHVIPLADHAVPADPPAGHNAMVGTVTDASFIGVSTQYQVQVASEQTMTVVSQNTGVAPAAPGQRVQLHWEAQRTFGLPGSQDVHSGIADPDVDD